MARLAVLYEDMALELYAAYMSVPPDSPMTAAGPNSWKLYFIRKATGSAYEFGQCLAEVARAKEFLYAVRIRGWDDHVSYREDWLPSVQFFSANKHLIADIRNDVGGHFGQSAAREALNNLEPERAAAAGYYRGHRGGTLLSFPFAIEIGATALLARFPNKPREEKIEDLLTLYADFVKYGARAVQFLFAEFFWNRFR